MSKKLSKRERRLKALQRLENIEMILENPCNVSWTEMQGSDRTRTCDRCQLTVYNFVGLPPDAILELIRQHESKLCAQLYVRADGTATLESCSTRAENLELVRGGLVVSAPLELLLPQDEGG
jgi:hypothetical protein